MEKIKTKRKLCLICMKEHDVDTVGIIDDEIYKNEEVTFYAIYEYCSNTDEFLENEEMIKKNSLAMKDAYRVKMGLLTSDEIIDIRRKYDISQKDFSEVLGWGKATITRYENHQVQDRIHDDVLRKIDDDPKWFLDMLKRTKGKIPDKAYLKYRQKANEEFKKKENCYLIDSIYAIYANFKDETITGGANLNLNKVVEMINYIAKNVYSLHKVKLMKMLWYSDMLHFKRHGKTISGLVYSALPLGAVPMGYDKIVLLDDVRFEVIDYGERIGYRFKPVPGFEIKELGLSEYETLDTIIYEFGNMDTNEIVKTMHAEEAYKHTNSNCIIPFSFAEQLSID